MISITGIPLGIIAFCAAMVGMAWAGAWWGVNMRRLDIEELRRK